MASCNVVISFLMDRFDNTDRENLSSEMLERFQLEDLEKAKRILVAECDKIKLSESITEYRKKRIGKDVKKKVMKDNIDLWDLLDRQKGGRLSSDSTPSSTDSASTSSESESSAFNPAPTKDAEITDYQRLLNAIQKLQESVDSRNEDIVWLKMSISCLYRRLDVFTDAESAQSEITSSPTRRFLQSRLFSPWKPSFTTFALN